MTEWKKVMLRLVEKQKKTKQAIVDHGRFDWFYIVAFFVAVAIVVVIIIAT